MALSIIVSLENFTNNKAFFKKVRGKIKNHYITVWEGALQQSVDPYPWKKLHRVSLALKPLVSLFEYYLYKECNQSTTLESVVRIKVFGSEGLP